MSGLVVATRSVSNGFVREGSALPYVFDASNPERVLPVCGVCGKSFACVTTMKRHLVTHTGEKPFACRICGKRYTQKGNLRVHERTHRNERPFECDVCHQRFYRKEPMIKHRFRQHNIVAGSLSNSSSCSSSSSSTPPCVSTCEFPHAKFAESDQSSPLSFSAAVKSEQPLASVYETDAPLDLSTPKPLNLIRTTSVPCVRETNLRGI